MITFYDFDQFHFVHFVDFGVFINVINCANVGNHLFCHCLAYIVIRPYGNIEESELLYSRSPLCF